MRHRLSRNDMQALREKEFSIETLSRYSFATTEGVSLSGMYPVSAEMQPLQNRIKSMACKFDACTNAVKEAANQELLDFVARRLYEMAAVCFMSHLIIQDATNAPDMFSKSALVYVNYAESEIEKHFNFIRKFTAEQLDNYLLKYYNHTQQ